jgi:hypothetical protein
MCHSHLRQTNAGRFVLVLQEASAMGETFASRNGINLWTTSHGTGIPVVL